jgi:hypothetical protein
MVRVGGGKQAIGIAAPHRAGLMVYFILFLVTGWQDLQLYMLNRAAGM